MELFYISIVSGIFGLIGLIFWSRSSMEKLVLRSELLDKKYKAMGDLEKIKARKSIELAKQRAAAKIGSSKGSGGGGLLDQLSNLDLDQVQDILSQVGELKDGSDVEGGGISSLLNSPIVQGFLQGRQQKNEEKDVPEEFKQVVFEE